MKAPAECDECRHVAKVYAGGQHSDNCESPLLKGITTRFSMAPACRALGYHQTHEQIAEEAPAQDASEPSSQKLQWARPQALGIMRTAK